MQVPALVALAAPAHLVRRAAAVAELGRAAVAASADLAGSEDSEAAVVRACR